MTTTPANAHRLLRDGEADVFADSGYRGAHKRQQVSDAPSRCALARGDDARQAAQIGQGEGSIDVLTDPLERTKARIRSKVEHLFRVHKRQCGHGETRYRGLAENTAQLQTLFVLANLWRVRQKIVQAAAG